MIAAVWRDGTTGASADRQGAADWISWLISGFPKKLADFKFGLANMSLLSRGPYRPRPHAQDKSEVLVLTLYFV